MPCLNKTDSGIENKQFHENRRKNQRDLRSPQRGVHKKLTKPTQKIFLKKSKKRRDCLKTKSKKMIDSIKSDFGQYSNLKSPPPLMNMRNRWITYRVGENIFYAHDLPLILIRLPIWRDRPRNHRCVYRR